MWIIVFIVVLVIALICLEIREKKQRIEDLPQGEFSDIAQLDYDEKIRKYKDDYDFNNPVLRNRF